MIRPLLWLPLAALSLSPALAQEASLKKQAYKLHALAGGEWCDSDGQGWAPEETYQEWPFSYVPEYNDGQAEQVTLIRIFCMAGAYNVQHAYYWYRDFEGLMPLAFAEPAFSAQYENDDGLDGALLGVTVTGMTSAQTLVNSDFDPETLTITSNSLWRGIGDARSVGTWVFADGDFVLKRYDIDASYDGQVNPETVLDYLAEE